MSINLGNKKWFFILAVVVAAVMAMSFWPDSEDELANMPKTVDFSYHIQPILSKNCFTCHGNDPSSRKAGLRLDLEDHAKSTLESGHRAIVPKNINKSELINRILSEDPKVIMPPPEDKKTLTIREKALIKKWIKQGAKWQDQWSLVAPKMPDQATESIAQTIDLLINEKLNEKNLTPSSKVNKNELIRRVSYLISGLPPTPQEVESFVKNENEDAYEEMLDAFLASTTFGERWARHWMDLVRYGESMGHEGDFNISNAYEYRDYLIRAFNADVPYDQFVIEHLAGDMLEHPRVNTDLGINESEIATGYLFLGDGKHAPVDIKLEEADKIDNMIDVTSKTFTAMTVSCARCHDHKFDPIPTADYYAMYGMMESTRLIPRQARKPYNQEELVEQLKEVKEDIKDELIDFISATDEDEINYSNPKKEVKSTSPDTSTTMLADFRSGHWNGWYTDGIAFGDSPVNTELALSNPNKVFKSHELFENNIARNSLMSFEDYGKFKDKYDNRGNSTKPGNGNNKLEILSGYASSRALAPGLQGVLHGPNFSNEFDTIAIRARGKNGTLRIVIDNFQVFQGPLWDKCEAVVNDDEWRTYKLSAHLAKGHKAYLEFFPGRFRRHIYGIDPGDYVEVEWAIGYSAGTAITDSEPPITANNKLSESELNIDQALLDKYYGLQEKLYDPSHFIGMAEGDGILSPIFNRGSHNNLSEEKVAHSFLSLVDIEKEFPKEGSGRLAWAESLVHPDNPLTARVMVNRIWHHIFGKGIVETVDNFGIQGKIPSHPQLLDYLALSFVENGWSIKSMIKQIMLSDAFQRSTTLTEANESIDVENIFLHAFPVRRLESEAIRDGILSVAGCLDREMFGEGTPVYLSNFMTGRGRPSVSGAMDSYGRRSIYQTVRRNFIPEMMLTFDMPIPFSTFGKRNTTNVPAQSLTLLNDPFVHDQAYAWAEKIVKTDLSIEERISQMYMTAFARMPMEGELDNALKFLTEQAEITGGTIDDSINNPNLWKEYCHMIFNFKEFIHLI